VAAALRCLDDASPLVRAAAVWALFRLAPERVWLAERNRRWVEERDPLVIEEWMRGGSEAAPALA
jgi:epoxyqueuosine reductase